MPGVWCRDTVGFLTGRELSVSAKHHTKHLLISLLLLCFTLPLLSQVQSQDSTDNTIHVLRIDGAIGPASSEYLRTGIEAAQMQAQAIIIEMDTPGGLDLAMRDIIQSILESDIPVITFVSPQGARAASAGTYILYASHIAAMAPATNLGAATPVQITAPSPFESPTDAETEEGESTQGAMERKMINDARAYIRGLAELRGRNAEWAESAVTEAASLSANEALAENVINLVADDLSALVSLLNGLEVTVNNQTLTLDTENANVQVIEPDWRISFLNVITNPNLILILGMIGMYGLVIEFYNPGFGLPGVLGAICILLAGYGLQLLPLNYTGVSLIALGVILIIAEAFVPSFGIMGLGGIVAFTLGALIMVETDVAVYQVSLPLVAALVFGFALLLIATMRVFFRIRKKAPVSGIQTIVGAEGLSMTELNTSGMVEVYGEVWNAESDSNIHKGEKIKVVGTQGAHLKVRKG